MTSFSKSFKLKSALAIISVVGIALGSAGCSAQDSPQELEGVPSVVVTTSILGDVVQNIVGEEASVTVLMPAGVDPHNFQPSTKEIGTLMGADLIVENGLGLEEGAAQALKTARSDGIKIVTVGDHINPLATLEHEGEEHDHDGHDDHEGHDHGPLDPHFWHDPARMMLAAEAITQEVLQLPGIDKNAIEKQSAEYTVQLGELDSDLDMMFGTIPQEKRKLVTGHYVFQYLAERYDFETVDSLIPSSSTIAEASAADLQRVSNKLVELQIPAIFTDASQSSRVAETVAKEAGGEVLVVALHSESLTPAGGEAETYDALMRINAERIIEALNG